ncbi:kinase-like domain-containing protein [Dichotomocladium elegans]|nr:kinase-like domain-containing protein [Dichotomocladium elegans]
MHRNVFSGCNSPKSGNQLQINTTPVGLTNYIQHVPSFSTSSATTSPSSTPLQSPAAQFLAQFLPPAISTAAAVNDKTSPCTGRVIGNYELDKIIGYGGFATVWRAFDISTGEQVAVKVFSNDENYERLERELAIWRSLDHPHLLRMHTTLEDDTGVHVVCDYCPSVLVKSLMEKKRFTEREAARIFGELCLAVAYLHKHNVCHRDIKLDNVLLDKNGRVKLADFGLATWLSFVDKTDGRAQATSGGGSLQYAPPDAEPLSLKTDMWSMGVLLFALVAGRLPFEDDYFPRLRKHIAEGRYEMPAEFSPKLQDLIRGLLCVNLEYRLCIHKTLRSSWLASF